ncbi:Protein kinase domain-containing protein [Psidium guajava]|nr:Protein kinase domain-containing protein [Psidium guajava]
MPTPQLASSNVNASDPRLRRRRLASSEKTGYALRGNEIEMFFFPTRNVGCCRGSMGGILCNSLIDSKVAAAFFILLFLPLKLYVDGSLLHNSSDLLDKFNSASLLYLELEIAGTVKQQLGVLDQ